MTVKMDLDFEGLNMDFFMAEEANLRGASFRGASLKNANFQRADLSGAHFDGAELSSAVFTGATISQTSFASANLFKVVFTNMRDGLYPKADHVVFDHANMDTVTFTDSCTSNTFYC